MKSTAIHAYCLLLLAPASAQTVGRAGGALSLPAPAAWVAPARSGALIAAPPAAQAPASLWARPSAARPASSAIRRVRRKVLAATAKAGPIHKACDASAWGLGKNLTLALAEGFQQPFSDAAVPADPGMVERRMMVQTLEQVASIFSGHYAPLEWKKEKFQLSLKQELEKSRREILDSPSMTPYQFQEALSRFVATLKDYHVGIEFFSTERARLPLAIAGSRGRYFIAFIDRDALPEKSFPYKVGDEVVRFDGEKVSDLAGRLLRAKGENTRLTDEAIAQMRLTSRVRKGGDALPSGEAELTVLRDGREEAVRVPWESVPELMPEPAPVRDAGNLLQETDPFGPSDALAAWIPKVRSALVALVPRWMSPLASIFSDDDNGPANPFKLASRESFVPQLGKATWSISDKSPLKAYIFENDEGRKIGYIRVPTFDAEADAAELFGKLVSKFQKETDALVLDQVNNPGGNLFHMLAVLSRLTGKPLRLPSQRIILSEEDAFQSIEMLKNAGKVQDDESAMMALGDSIAGYAVTYEVWRCFVDFAKFVLKELKAGRRFSELFFVPGIREVAPHPVQRYTKPVLVLVNPLDFSCADLLPAILQDNGRAKLFGQRTSGAGGAVKSVTFPNQFGIAELAYTWTIAVRESGKPIENLGVEPDYPYAPTPEDFQSSFSGYKRAVNEALKDMLKAPAPGAL